MRALMWSARPNSAVVPRDVETDVADAGAVAVDRQAAGVEVDARVELGGQILDPREAGQVVGRDAHAERTALGFRRDRDRAGERRGKLLELAHARADRELAAGEVDELGALLVVHGQVVGLLGVVAREQLDQADRVVGDDARAVAALGDVERQRRRDPLDVRGDVGRAAEQRRRAVRVERDAADALAVAVDDQLAGVEVERRVELLGQVLDAGQAREVVGREAHAERAALGLRPDRDRAAERGRQLLELADARADDVVATGQVGELRALLVVDGQVVGEVRRAVGRDQLDQVDRAVGDDAGAVTALGDVDRQLRRDALDVGVDVGGAAEQRLRAGDVGDDAADVLAVAVDDQLAGVEVEGRVEVRREILDARVCRQLVGLGVQRERAAGRDRLDRDRATELRSDALESEHARADDELAGAVDVVHALLAAGRQVGAGDRAVGRDDLDLADRLVGVDGDVVGVGRQRQRQVRRDLLDPRVDAIGAAEQRAGEAARGERQQVDALWRVVGLLAREGQLAGVAVEAERCLRRQVEDRAVGLDLVREDVEREGPALRVGLEREVRCRSEGELAQLQDARGDQEVAVGDVVVDRALAAAGDGGLGAVGGEQLDLAQRAAAVDRDAAAAAGRVERRRHLRGNALERAAQLRRATEERLRAVARQRDLVDARAVAVVGELAVVEVKPEIELMRQVEDARVERAPGLGDARPERRRGDRRRDGRRSAEREARALEARDLDRGGADGAVVVEVRVGRLAGEEPRLAVGDAELGETDRPAGRRDRAAAVAVLSERHAGRDIRQVEDGLLDDRRGR